jgi:hypothetical protein
MLELIERPDVLTEAMLLYLDDLRDGAEINMGGAVPYLILEFELTKRAARAVLAYWRHTYDERHPPEQA